MGTFQKTGPILLGEHLLCNNKVCRKNTAVRGLPATSYSVSKAANRLNRAARTLDDISLFLAVPGDSEMAQRKVVSDRVLGVQPAQTLRYVLGHPPTRAAHIGESDIVRNPRNVRVQ